MEDLTNLIWISAGVCILTIIIVVVVLNVLQNSKNKKYKRIIDNLDIEKNKIDGAPIRPELAKIEAFLKNEKIEVLYNDWKKRLDVIKATQIPKLTDMIVEAEFSLSQMNYKATTVQIAKLEMEMYKVRTNSEFLLDEIKEITTSEEKNRAIVTKLKIHYRELYEKFNATKDEYGEIANSIDLQFENIAKKFEEFEKIMEQNEYTEVTKIIKAIDEMLKHMEGVIEEVPTIVLMATSILPKKIEEAKENYDRLLKQGYPLDYLNVEYNIDEANKKIKDVLDRSRVLNLEDSLFELKVLMDYFDSLFTDFDKEKVNRENYEKLSNSFKERLDKLNKLIEDIFAQIDEIKDMYNLKKEDIELLNSISNEIKALNGDYKLLLDHTSNNTFAYSKLTKEMELLVLKLSSIEDRLDNSLDTIGSMKEDEGRAKQQLDEIKSILEDAKLKMREFKLPVIPRNYYVELEEASAAIKEINKELEGKPINIPILNTRVDTARDLSLKLLGKTKEMIKTAMFAEMAIVYGNRYRSSYEELDGNLTYSEVLYFKGEYQKSLEATINALNNVESGIYNRLLKLYSKEKKES